MGSAVVVAPIEQADRAKVAATARASPAERRFLVMRDMTSSVVTGRAAGCGVNRSFGVVEGSDCGRIGNLLHAVPEKRADAPAGQSDAGSEANNTGTHPDPSEASCRS
ncbi:hypothetical protein GCM10010460_19990 [Microbacterium terrae]|nr:hypothetical protein GCM10017594_06610 [Microbacterium terrae]